MDKILKTLRKEWHPKKNGDAKLSDFKPHSNRPAWWQCERGHVWQTQIRVRYRGFGCPFCSGFKTPRENSLQKTNPHLASEWHPTKNKDLTPRKVSAGSGKRVWWQCEKGHEWQAVINDRNYGRGCPHCIGANELSELNNLEARFPALAREWHPARNGNLTAADVKLRSTLEVWWHCDQGHEWKASVQARTVNRKKCPHCSKHSKKKKPTFR